MIVTLALVAFVLSLGDSGLFMIVLAYWRKIKLEEESLREAFNSDYDEYRRETWALLQGIF